MSVRRRLFSTKGGSSGHKLVVNIRDEILHGYLVLYNPDLDRYIAVSGGYYPWDGYNVEIIGEEWIAIGVVGQDGYPNSYWVRIYNPWGTGYYMYSSDGRIVSTDGWFSHYESGYPFTSPINWISYAKNIPYIDISGGTLGTYNTIDGQATGETLLPESGGSGDIHIDSTHHYNIKDHPTCTRGVPVLDDDRNWVTNLKGDDPNSCFRIDNPTDIPSSSPFYDLQHFQLPGVDLLWSPPSLIDLYFMYEDSYWVNIKCREIGLPETYYSGHYMASFTPYSETAVYVLYRYLSFGLGPSIGLMDIDKISSTTVFAHNLIPRTKFISGSAL